MPLGADSSESWSNKIILPKIDRVLFVEALIKSGLSRETSEKYSKESARNITILRRQLEFIRNLPDWAKPENVREIIPALIVGRWDENFENDRNIIAKIAGESYEEYSKKLNRWRYTSDSPLEKIGSMWRLASPLDAWINASKNLTSNDFELLHLSFLEVMREINPKFDIEPDKRQMASFYGRARQNSLWIREGLTQSLILVSIYGNQLNFNLPVFGEVWVDKVVHELLDSNDASFWKSIESELPLLSEASPISFLNAIEEYLAFEDSPIVALFEEESGFLNTQSYHTGLLWALENLAWLPEYLSSTAIILAQLSAKDPGGNLSNRPINSLSEIFKAWHPQTLASFEQRKSVLELISKKEPNIAWILLIRMLPDSHSIGYPTNKMRWRTFDQSLEKPLTYEEIWDTHSAVVDLLILIFDFSEIKLAQIVEESVKLSFDDREKVLTFVETKLDKIKHSENLAWKTIRGILYQHRSFPNTDWAFPETILERYEKIYWALEPTDEILKTIWMFDDYFPKFTEGFNYKKVTNEEQSQIINTRRTEGLKKIYETFGVNKIIELCSTVKESGILGDVLAPLVEKEDEILIVCQQLKKGNDNLKFAHSFLFKKLVLNGIEWGFELFSKLKNADFSDADLAQMFIPINQSNKLWEFIDALSKNIRQEYWLNMVPQFWGLPIEEKIIGLNYLIEFKRYFSAINICSHYEEEIPTPLIIDILNRAATDSANEKMHLHGYELERLFETIENRGDSEQLVLIRLEWLYLDVIYSHGSSRCPNHLHQELANNPTFFIDVLKWAYKSNNEEINEKEESDLIKEQIVNRGNQAYLLLENWKKIPGVNDAGEIDPNKLGNWIKIVRDLAEKAGRLDVADMTIGQVLAQYPESIEFWPPDEICNVIEQINTDSIKSSFSSATFNKRSFSTRGAFDGGEIERGKAAYFRKLVENHKNKFPSVTNVFEKLAKGYELDASRMDERAEQRRLEY